MKFLKSICVLLLLMIGSTCAYSCASIDGYLMNEATVIVWNKQTHTEHFIRRATFDDIKSKSVGFIVPTPAVPQLAEGDADVFFGLDEMMSQERETRKLPAVSLTSWIVPSWKMLIFQTPKPPWSDLRAGAAADAAMPAVEVLQQQRIGDLDATTVRASDAKALNRWLAKHDYSSSPAFENWLKNYVQKGWVVTAFKFARNSNDSALSSPLIRMSFKTDQPFYPYSEPQDAKAMGGRELRIFLFASGKMQAAQGKFGKFKKWRGEVKWSDDVQNHPKRLKNFEPPLSQQLGLPEDDLKQAHWMTVFEDYSASRQGDDDVIFIPASDEKMVPPTIVKYEKTQANIPVEGVVLIVVMVGVFIKMAGGRGGSLEK